MPTPDQLYEAIGKINESLTDFQLTVTEKLTEVKQGQKHQQKEIDALVIDVKALNTKVETVVEKMQPSKSKTAIMFVFFMAFVSSAGAMVWKFILLK